MQEEIDLSPTPATHVITNRNTLCDVQITWHGGVKQRAATALAETRITQSQPDHCQVLSLSEQCGSTTGNNVHHIIRCSLVQPLGVKIQYAVFFPPPDSDAEPAARAQCPVQGRVRGPEKDHPDRGGLQTAEGPQHYHDGGRTRPRPLLRLLRTCQTLPE